MTDLHPATPVSHTPGPWTVEDSSPKYNLFEINAGAINLADIYWALPSQSSYATMPQREEANANARLMAAAPDMLNALEWAYTFISGEERARPNPYNAEFLDRVRDAIELATGQRQPCHQIYDGTCRLGSACICTAQQAPEYPF